MPSIISNLPGHKLIFSLVVKKSANLLSCHCVIKIKAEGPYVSYGASGALHQKGISPHDPVLGDLEKTLQLVPFEHGNNHKEIIISSKKVYFQES